MRPLLINGAIHTILTHVRSLLLPPLTSWRALGWTPEMEITAGRILVATVVGINIVLLKLRFYPISVTYINFLWR